VKLLEYLMKLASVPRRVQNLLYLHVLCITAHKWAYCYVHDGIKYLTYVRRRKHISYPMHVHITLKSKFADLTSWI
jgi:hypothetical protein